MTRWPLCSTWHTVCARPVPMTVCRPGARRKPQPGSRAAGRRAAAGGGPVRGAVYRRCGRASASRFEQALLQLLQTPDCYLVLAARADFYANLMASPLWEQIRDHRLEITPPRGDALREAIALPARDVGVRAGAAAGRAAAGRCRRRAGGAALRPGDAGDAVGARRPATPSVSTPTPTWWATRAGARGCRWRWPSMPNMCTATCWRTTPSGACAQRILLRLVQFGEGRADTRRQQTVDELRKGSAQRAAARRL